MVSSTITSYENQPSVVTVYIMPEPLDTSIASELQAELILANAQLHELNPAASLSMGIDDPDAFRGLTMASMLLGASGDEQALEDLRSRLKSFIEKSYCLEDLSTEWTVADTTRHFKTSYHGFVEDGKLLRILVIHRDESVRRLQEQLVSNVAQYLAAESDDKFFAQLCSRLAETLGVDYAAVAETVGPDGMVRILAFYDGREAEYVHAENEYSLKGTPGYEVLHSGKERLYRFGVSKSFPNDIYLKKYRIDSYVGVPIYGANYQLLGLIYLMHRTELPSVELCLSVLNIFAIRVSAEIERQRIDKEKSKREQQQKIFIENNSSGMFVVDIEPPMPTNLSLQKQVQWLADNTRFVECNKSLIKILAVDGADTLLGSSLYSDLVYYDFATHAREFVSNDHYFKDHLVQLTLFDGDSVWISANISSVEKDGHITQMLGVLNDVSDREIRSRDMEYRAKHDGLTGLPNRSSFIEHVEQVLKLSRASSKHALFLLDLDGFKEVNDTLGHETGDYLLQQIGPRIAPAIKPVSISLARLGGDEFALLVEDYDTEEQVKELAEQMMAGIKSPFTINELELVVGGSVGIALYPANGDSVSSLMRCADIAMYEAKQQSQDYCVYSTDRDHYTVRRLSLMMDIRQAVANNELRLFYQPIIQLQGEKVIGFEALIRWDHPEHGMLSPGEFIPLIELTDMIMPVTWWVVETAIKQLSDWRELGWDYVISVNVSTRNLIDAGFVSFIETCLARYQVQGEFLEMEITESTLMADPEKARRVLQEVSTLGVRISVDDYGTGYSSLAYLKSLPIDTLKIDRTFISQMMTNSLDEIIVNSTVQLAHNLGLNVTAEGIEHASLIKTLELIGCDKGQGYYFCKPIPLEELNVWLALYKRKEITSQSA